MITVQSIISRLTDVFTKDPNSNIGKLMTIMADQIRELEETQNRIKDWRDIDLAQGTTLDRIGENVVQPRGVATDEIYRIMLKSKIARNLSASDMNSIIQVLSIALDTDPSAIEIKEMYADPQSPEPASIAITKLPLQVLNESGMTLPQLARIVQRTVAAGVSVGVIELEGTLSFGGFVPTLVPFIYGNEVVNDQYMINDQTLVPDDLELFMETLFGIQITEGSEFVPEFSEENGLSNLEGTTGGYFGAAFVSNEDNELPI